MGTRYASDHRAGFEYSVFGNNDNSIPDEMIPSIKIHQVSTIDDLDL